MRKILAAIFWLILLAVFWQPREAHATACTAGCTQYVFGSSFSGTSVSATLAGVTAGHGVHVFFCLNGPTAVTGVTVGGNAATLGGTTATGGGQLCGMAAYANAASGSNAVVVNATGTCSNCSVWAEEWAGDATSGLLDGQNATYTAGTTGTSLPCGSISPANSGDVVEAVLFQPQNVAPTDPSGFSAAYTYSTYFFATYKSGAASGAQNPTFTGGTNSYDNINVCAAFKQAGGGGGGPPPGSLRMRGFGK